MYRNHVLAAIAAFVIATGSAYAAQIPPERMLEMSRNISRIIGLSAAGTETWARLSVERAAVQKFEGVDRIDREIGEELATAAPNRAKLAALARAYAAEKARFERVEKDRLIADALRLSDPDRRTLGRFIVRSHTTNGSSAPVLAPLP